MNNSFSKKIKRRRFLMHTYRETYTGCKYVSLIEKN